MYVTRVELENIKSYERADFSFERGTTAIVGPNGAGKTTILEAIAWAIFDTLDYSKEDFTRRGARRGSVRVTFQSDLDERLYTVYRDTGTGYYVYDQSLGLKLAEKKADVKKFIDLHLGVEPGTDLKALFRSAVGVPQGFFTSDFLRTPTERKASFDRLLKVEEYRESAERLRNTVTLINERMVEARVRISGAEAQLARYDETIAAHVAALERIAELSTALENYQREAERRALTVAELDATERRVTETRAAAERLEVEHASALRRLEDLRVMLEAARRARGRQAATEPDHGAHLEAQETLHALEAERQTRDRLRAEAAEAARHVVRAEGDLRRLEEAFERAAHARLTLAELAPEIAAQEELERERERLRDLLAQARAARERLARLDRELELLRRQHAETAKRVRATENLAGAQERVEKLESERLDVETRLSTVDKALAERKHLANRRRDLVREAERLHKSITTLEREARTLEQAAAQAQGLAQLEARERELTHKAAHLRAAIERDERVRTEAKGGLCPIMGERCTSFSEGQTLESFFAEQLKRNRAALVTVERESVSVVQSVRVAREAEKTLARYEATRSRLQSERELLGERETALAELDAQLANLPEATGELLDRLQAQLFGIDGVLKNAREDARRYAELEPLRARLKEIEAEGKAKREERDEVAAASSADVSLEEDIKEVEQRLRRLNDPRGRAVSLRAEAEREEVVRLESQVARTALLRLQKQKDEIDAALQQLAHLDARWAEVTARRDATLAGYREYLESASLARTLPERERDAEAAAERLAQAVTTLEQARREHEQATKLYDRERHNQERAALALARERAADTSARLEAARENESRLGAEIARLDEVRERMREEFLAKERLEQLHQATDFVRSVLREAGPYVTESYVTSISIEANQLFREITGEGGRSLRWSKDYDIMLEEGGHERSFVNLSGGEQMVAALSIRLALLKQLSDIRVAFFDEPTVNMDEERRERLAQQLGQVRHFDQMFVISHDDTFEQTVDHVITVGGREAHEAA